MGLSLHSYLEAAHKQGRAPFNPDDILPISDIGDMDPSKLVIVTTGSQVTCPHTGIAAFSRSTIPAGVPSGSRTASLCAPQHHHSMPVHCSFRNVWCSTIHIVGRAQSSLVHMLFAMQCPATVPVFRRSPAPSWHWLLTSLLRTSSS